MQPNFTIPLAINASRLEVYTPRRIITTKKNEPMGTIWIVVPGGSYRPGPFGWCKTAEGSDVARWLASDEVGVVGAVLHYRFPAGRPEATLSDIFEAIETVRRWARRGAFGSVHYNVDVGQPLVGVMGFSAGGHLAALAATEGEAVINGGAWNLVRNRRPDMFIGFYPLITMDESSGASHTNSRREFLGRVRVAGRGAFSEASLVRAYSAEHRVTNATSPTLIVHARDDQVVPIGGSRSYCEACKRRGAHCTLVELSRGGHPFVTKPDPWRVAQRAAVMWMRATSKALSEQRPNAKGAVTWRPVYPPLRAAGSNFPMLKETAIALRDALLHASDVEVAKVDSTTVLMPRSSLLAAARRVLIPYSPPAKSTPRPPPWITETFDDPAPGDNRPHDAVAEGATGAAWGRGGAGRHQQLESGGHASGSGSTAARIASSNAMPHEWLASPRASTRERNMNAL